MTDRTLRGRVVWHELMTPDPTAAHKYYNDVFHWKTATWDQNPSYKMFSTGGERIGGTVAQDEGAPHWLHYIGTPDLDATIDQATSLGALLVQGATDISAGSRYAVLTDPQGAEFAVYSAPGDPPEERTPRRGEFSWLELATTNANEALHFYSALFGWERTAAHDMGPMGFYYLFGRNGLDIGGAFDKPAQMPGPPAWLGYVRGKDMDEVVTKAKAGGGTLVNGPMEVPGGDWIAQMVDPQGAMFAVHVVKTDVEAARAREEPVPAKASAPARSSAVRTRSSAVKKAAVSRSARNKSTVSRKAAAKAKKKAVRKSAKVKSVKRAARKAGTVRTRSTKVTKAKAAPRKKSGVKKKSAKAKKGK